MILEGRVTVNGRLAVLGQSADAQTDDIRLDGKKLPTGDAPVYIMLNKPRGFVTTVSDEQGRRTVMQLVDDCGVRVYPVGRLDLSSEGLLLMTNDGEFTKKMTHPSHEIDKTYLVWVTGYTPERGRALARPIALDGYALRPADVQTCAVNGEQAQLRVTIHEGRYRQVRRMCEAVGLHATRLRRIAQGGAYLGDLPVGKWRYLTQEEKDLLMGGER